MKIEAGQTYIGGGCPRKVLSIEDGIVEWIHDSGDYRDSIQFSRIDEFEQWIHLHSRVTHAG